MKGKFVAYYRVSTQRQGNSGLGLDAQKKAVMDYLNGGKWELLKEYTEVESGKGSSVLEKRPVLNDAIAFAKKNNATLIIAKLDRLARDVLFIVTLQVAKIKFVCADMPEANEMTIQIMAAVAQYEAKRISERTKEALAQAKARGVQLGNPNLKADNTARIQRADNFAKNLKQTIRAYQNDGLSQREIVEQLNNTGVKTPRGKSWHLVSLQRVIKRIND
jgi:DNA invertase Pin-like site-specific DNA recombinase